MSNIISELPDFAWGDLIAPCGSASVEFSHNQAEHAYPYIDVPNHDWTGRNSLIIKVRLFFINTVQPESFPSLWEDWQEALFDGNSRELTHPVLGPMRARVKDGSIEIVAQNRGGITVDVTFIETRDEVEEAIAFDALSLSPEAVAAASDAALESLTIPMPPTTPPTTSLLDSVNQIKGNLFSIETSVSGAINQLSGVVTDLIETVDALNDAAAWPAHANLVGLWGLLQDLKTRAAKVVARPTKKGVTSSETTLEALATKHGNTLNDMMGLNLQLLRSPKIPKNTGYIYYS